MARPWLAWPLCLGLAAAEAHPYPTRGVDENRSGYAPHSRVPFPLPPASWVSEVRGLNRHQTPAIDADRNVYVGSDQGVLQSYDYLGRLRWSIQAGTASVQNAALSGDYLYTATKDGYARAIHKDTGKELWKSKVSDALPGDTYSPTAFDDFVVIPAGALQPFGSPDVVCVNKSDGAVRWKYSVGDKYGGATGATAKNGIGPKYSTVNLCPCYWNSSIIFNDVSGAMFRLSIADGKEMWYVPGDDKDMYTLGGSSCGPNGMAYLGYSSSPGQGVMQTFDMATGKKLWRVPVPMEIHAAPAVGYIDGKLTAVAGVGQPTGYPDATVSMALALGGWRDAWRALRLSLGYDKPEVTGHVVAFDALTGEVRWSFTPPAWRENSCAGSSWDQVCLPDLWTGAVIDAAGTVWIQWSAGGVVYGLRDRNGDGKVDLGDPEEVTSHDCGSAGTGPVGVAQGMLVAVTCKRVVAFVE